MEEERAEKAFIEAGAKTNAVVDRTAGSSARNGRKTSKTLGGFPSRALLQRGTYVMPTLDYDMGLRRACPSALVRHRFEAQFDVAASEAWMMRPTSAPCSAKRRIHSRIARRDRNRRNPETHLAEDAGQTPGNTQWSMDDAHADPSIFAVGGSARCRLFSDDDFPHLACGARANKQGPRGGRRAPSADASAPSPPQGSSGAEGLRHDDRLYGPERKRRNARRNRLRQGVHIVASAYHTIIRARAACRSKPSSSPKAAASLGAQMRRLRRRRQHTHVIATAIRALAPADLEELTWPSAAVFLGRKELPRQYGGLRDRKTCAAAW